MPSVYGMTLDEVMPMMDSRPVSWTVYWVSFAILVLGAALLRAGVLQQRGHRPGDTTARGVVWLWAATAGSWFYVLVAWDMQLYDVLELTRIEPAPFGLANVLMSSGMLALLIAPVWSLVSVLVLQRREGRRTSP